MYFSKYLNKEILEIPFNSNILEFADSKESLLNKRFFKSESEYVNAF